MTTLDTVALPLSLEQRGFRDPTLIGAGQSGAVFSAVDGSGRRVAVKILRGPGGDGAGGFESEFRILRHLAHPHLVAVHDYGSLDGGLPYFSMDWVEGAEFDAALFRTADGTVDERQLAEVLLQIASALHYVHGRNIVHGDIKPGNILVGVNPDGTRIARLMDFGLARMRGMDDAGVAGTIDYMAPEVIRREPATPASDLYSLGCVAYEAIAGTPPFQGETDLDVLRGHLRQPVDVAALRVADPFRTWISILMTKEPGGRYRSAEALQRDIAAYLGRGDGGTPDAPPAAVQLPELSRQAEIAKVLELRDLAATTAQTVIVTGAPGMGKTHFLRELQTELQVNGETPARIACTSSPVVFHPILSLLADIVRAGVPTADVGQVPVLAAAFPQAFPDVVPADMHDMDADTRKLRLHHAAATLIAHAGIRSLFIEDVDNADDFTLEFLLYLVGYLQANPATELLLVVTTAGDPAFITEEPTLDRDGVTVIALAPMSLAQMTAAVEQMYGAHVSPSFVSILWKRSQGVPGALRELLEFCTGEGILERTADGWVVHERENLGAYIPSGDSEFIARKLAGMGEDERRLFRAVCASPVAAPIEAVAFAIDRPMPDVLAWSATLAGLRLLRVDGGAFILETPTARDILPDTGAECRAMHDRYAEWYRANDGRDAETLAHHLYRSSDPAPALPHMLAAAEARKLVFDNTGAEKLYEQGLTLATGEAMREQRFEILDATAELNNLLGNRTMEQECIEELLMIGAQSGEPGRLARVFRRQTEYYLAGGEFDRARKSAEKALGYSRSDNDLPGEAWCHQKIGFCEYRSRPGEGVIGHYLKALEMFAALEARRDEGNLLIDIGLVHYSVLKQPDKAIEYFERARALFESLGFTRGVARALGNEGRQFFHLGNYERAYTHYLEALDLFTKISDRRLIAIGCHALGQCETVLGKYSDALLHLRQGLTIAKETGDLYAREMMLETLGETYFLIGRYDLAGEAYREARGIAEKTGNNVGVITNDIDLAGVHIELREVEEAMKILKRTESALEQVEEINVYCMFLYRSGIAQLGRGDKRDLEAAIESFRLLGDISDEHEFLAHQVLSRSYSGYACLLAGRIPEALIYSTEAIALLEKTPHIIGGRQDIFLNHARVLRATRNTTDAQTFIEKAHAELMAIADSIHDVHHYRSFLERVRINAEIQREYALVHRSDTPQAAAAIRERNLQTLYEVSAKMISVLDLSDLLESIMDSALVAMNGERGMIFLLENDQLTLKVSRNVEQETIEDASEISRSILRDVVSGGKPILISDTSKNEGMKSRESVVNFNIHSIICVPMKLKSRIIGTVYVDSRSDAMQALSFSDFEADFLEAFANLASVALENAWMHEKLKAENLYLRREAQRQFGFENIIGSSQPMQKLFREMEAGITSEGSVLISGESGTGKELVARAIHYNGGRKNAKFVAVDCGAVQDTLLESELFGYKRGAFTGAYNDKRGLFEEAHNGTLFLDEISNTSLAFQAKLLRVLQEGEFRRIGDTVTRTVNVRVICATNKDIVGEVRQERFRQDLFYRLNVIPITIPPLRDRTADIPLLVQHFIDRYNQKNAGSCRGASEEFLLMLQSLPWKGNVRELENLVFRILPQMKEEVLTTHHLPEEYRAAVASPQAVDRDFIITMQQGKRLATLQEIEREHISYVLKSTKNKTDAAAILGLKRTTLVEKMKKLGMM